MHKRHEVAAMAPLPADEEQERIATFLSPLDANISGAESQLEAAKRYK